MKSVLSDLGVAAHRHNIDVRIEDELVFVWTRQQWLFTPPRESIDWLVFHVDRVRRVVAAAIVGEL